VPAPDVATNYRVRCCPLRLSQLSFRLSLFRALGSLATFKFNPRTLSFAFWFLQKMRSTFQTLLDSYLLTISHLTTPRATLTTLVAREERCEGRVSLHALTHTNAAPRVYRRGLLYRKGLQQAATAMGLQVYLQVVGLDLAAEVPAGATAEQDVDRREGIVDGRDVHAVEGEDEACVVGG
jgi:hypothetical protein